jgi:hypothetical protein
MKKYLNILTTATPRADLHNRSFFVFLKMLYDSCPSYTIRLFVNLDKPSLSLEEEFEEAKQNILSNNDKYEIHLSTNEVNPSFNLAAKTIFLRCADQIKKTDQNIFFWLEDDWALYDTIENPQKVQVLENAISSIDLFFEDKNIFLMMTSTDYINGKPYLFKYNLFDAIVKRYRKSRIPDDPELTMILAKQFLFGEKKDRVNVIVRPYTKRFLLFHDVGIPWRLERNIKKTNRSLPEVDYTWSTNRKTVVTIWRNPVCKFSEKIKARAEKYGMEYEEKIIGINCAEADLPEQTNGSLPSFFFYEIYIGDYDRCVQFLVEEKMSERTMVGM